MTADESPPRILLVDDEEAAAATAEGLERERGDFAVEIETDAGAALERVRTGAVDCVLSGVELSGTDGLAFLETVRAEHPELPFVLYTAEGSDDVASEAVATGVTDCLRRGSDADHYALLANRIGDAVARYRADRGLERVESRYRALVEESTDVVSIVDTDGTVRYVSPAGERVFGYSPEEVVGDDCFEYVHPEDRPVVEERFEALLAEPEGRMNVEFRARDHEGTWVDLEVRARNSSTIRTSRGSSCTRAT